MCDDFLHEFLDYSQGYIYLLKHIQISSFISKCPASCLFPPSDDVLFLCIWNWLDMWYLQSEDFHSPFLSTLLSHSLFRKMIVLTVGFFFRFLVLSWTFGCGLLAFNVLLCNTTERSLFIIECDCTIYS